MNYCFGGQLLSCAKECLRMHAVAISGFDVNMSCKKLSLHILQIELALRLPYVKFCQFLKFP